VNGVLSVLRLLRLWSASPFARVPRTIRGKPSNACKSVRDGRLPRLSIERERIIPVELWLLPCAFTPGAIIRTRHTNANTHSFFILPRCWLGTQLV